MIVALQHLGMPVSCGVDGPFSVSFGNSLLKPFGVQLCQHVELGISDGKYIVHDGAKLHFFAMVVREDLVEIIDDAASCVVPLSSLSSMLLDPNFTMYRCQALAHCQAMQKDVIGGAGVLSKSIYSTHLKSCHCGHRSMSKAHDVKAVVFTLAGEISTTVRTMRCNAYSCRTTFGPNYFVEANKKVNTAAPHHVSEVLFVSPKVGFSADYLRYHIALEFRAYVPTRAVQSVYESVFGMCMNEDWFREFTAML